MQTKNNNSQSQSALPVKQHETLSNTEKIPSINLYNKIIQVEYNLNVVTINSLTSMKS